MILLVIRMVLSAVFLALICFTDLKSSVIRNNTVLSFSALGLAASLFDHSILSSLIGMIFPLVLLPLFAGGMLGAGDIKAFCCLGAIWGFSMDVRIIVCSFLAGGVIALVIMLFRGDFIARIKKIISYLWQCVIARKLLPYEEDRNGRFRFAYSIAAGTVIAVIRSVVLKGQ